MRDEQALRLEHVSKAYGSVQALDDVCLTIHQGEVYGLIGESGCGKTTLARCVMQLETWDEGSIWIDGQPCSKKPNRTRRRELAKKRAIVFQEGAASLDRKSRVRDVLQEPFRITGRPVDEARLKALLARCRLDVSLMERSCATLSGGQLQRLAIARALALEPDLLVADEPIASLDVSLQAQIVNVFKDLQETEGFALLLIGHDLDMIRFVADRVGVMYGGRIVEQARTEDLFGDPRHPHTKALIAAALHVDEARRDDFLFEQPVEKDGAYEEVGLEHVVWKGKKRS